MRGAGWLGIAVLPVCAAVCVPAFGIEVTTGYLIGPRYDARAFYVRASGSGTWQKTYAGSEYRRQAQGKLLGVRMPGALHSDEAVERAIGFLDRLRECGALMTGVELQSDGTGASAFNSDGSPRENWFGRLDRFLREADKRAIVVTIVLFHHQQDENFDSPDAILNAAKRTTDWLIRGRHRNVILNIAENWSAAGWDHDGFVTEHLEQIVNTIRDEFQAQKTDFAVPVAITSVVHLSEKSTLIDTSDLVMVRDAGLTIDPRRIERPEIVMQASNENSDGCLAAFERTSGWLMIPTTLDLERQQPVLEQIARLTLNHPAKARVAAAK